MEFKNSPPSPGGRELEGGGNESKRLKVKYKKFTSKVISIFNL
jgi:hypothetical protein